MKIYRSLCLCIIVLFMFTGVGCTKTVKPPQTKPDEGLKGTLTILSLDSELKAVQLSADNFRKKYPDVTINIQNVSKDEGQNRFKKMELSNEADIDIVAVNDSSVQALVNNYKELFSDVSSIAKTGKDGFIKSKIDTLTVNGKVYGVPADSQPVAIFYRTDIFDSLQINPEKIKTWDDFITAGKAVKVSGKYMLPVAIENDDWFFRTLLSELNTFYFDKDGKPVLNSDKSLTALTVYKKLFAEGIIYPYNSEDDLMKAVKSGSIAALPLDPYLAHELMEKAPEMKGKWGAMELPAFEAGGNRGALSEGDSFMITDKSKNEKLASEFVTFASMDKGNMASLLSNYGMFPGYTPLYNENIIQSAGDYNPKQSLWKVFAQSAVESYGYNYTPYFEDTKKLIPDYIKRIILVNQDAKTNMDDLQNQIQSKLK